MATGIGTVSAETLTGTLTSAGSFVSEQTNFSVNTGANGPWAYPAMHITNIEYTAGTATLIHFDSPGYITTYYGEAATNPGLTKPFTASISGTEVGHGTMGYQRLYSGTPATEIAGYQYLIFDEWNVTGRTGTVEVNINYNTTDWYMNPSGYSGILGDHPTGYFQWGGSWHSGSWQGGTNGNVLVNKNTPFSNDYSVTKPAGLMIQGNVTKGEYGSRVYVINADTGAVVASESTVNTNPYYFDVFAGSIRLSLFSSGGSWFNTSNLFTGTTTPTPTPTPSPGATIAPGYVRTTVNVRDRSGAMIHGVNIQMKDTGGTWSNSTADADAIHFIDTLPGHTINMYADFDIFANEFLPGSLLTQTAGSTYYLTLDPYESGATEGNVSLYVEVKEPSGSFIPYANVQIFLPNGYSYSGSTANMGSKVFLVPNDTQIRATGTASGYLPATIIGNSGSGGSTTMTITLDRQVVTTAPTSTIPPGGVTPAVTVDTRSVNQKDMDMMGQIRTAGPDLIDLAIAVTMISLLGLMMKGFK